jgi:hypothetical protein
MLATVSTVTAIAATTSRHRDPLAPIWTYATLKHTHEISRTNTITDRR